MFCRIFFSQRLEVIKMLKVQKTAALLPRAAVWHSNNY